MKKTIKLAKYLIEAELSEDSIQNDSTKRTEWLWTAEEKEYRGQQKDVGKSWSDANSRLQL